MLGAAFVKKLLQNVEFSASGSGDQLTVTAPFWRTDIAIAEDIVEEIGRLRGLDTLPAVMQKKAGLPPSANASLELQQNIRNILASAGAHEVLTYSFVHGNVITKANQDEQRAFGNPIALCPKRRQTVRVVHGFFLRPDAGGEEEGGEEKEFA